MATPNGFTKEEYEGYLHCMSKLALGDEVEIYLNARGGGIEWRPSPLVSNMSAIVKVAGQNGKTWLFVSDRTDIGFWKLSMQSHNCEKTIPNIRQYQYSYWSYISDVRIKRIIKHQ